MDTSDWYNSARSGNNDKIFCKAEAVRTFWRCEFQDRCDEFTLIVKRRDWRSYRSRNIAGHIISVFHEGGDVSLCIVMSMGYLIL